MLILTFGWVDWKSATVFSQKALPGPVVALCQNCIVTGPPLLELSSLPPPQAAKVTVLNATTAAAAKILLGAMKLSPLTAKSFGRCERGRLLEEVDGHVGTPTPHRAGHICERRGTHDLPGKTVKLLGFSRYI